MLTTSALEQFLLLSDIAYTNMLLLVIKPVTYFIVSLLSLFSTSIPTLTTLLTDVFTFNELITRFNLIETTTSIADNIIFNLINIQYYKLNFFLVFVCLLLHFIQHPYFQKRFFN